MQDAFYEFLDKPSKDSYLRVRALVLADPRYDPYSNEFSELNDLFTQEKWPELKAKVRAMMPNWLLTPRVHRIAAWAADKLGEKELTQMEALIAQRCVEGILSTGDGSETRPYLVTRTADEYDILQHIEKEFTGQALIERDGKTFDQMTCKDGSAIWFDVSDAFDWLKRNKQKD